MKKQKALNSVYKLTSPTVCGFFSWSNWRQKRKPIKKVGIFVSWSHDQRPLMGCVSSKQTVSVTPAFDHSGALRDNAGAGSVGTNSGRSRVGLSEINKKRSSGSNKRKKNSNSGVVSDLGGRLGLSGSDLGESGRASSRSDSLSLRLGNLQKYIEGEHVAAGWPAWLSAVAGEAIHGWVPLKADSYEKLEKVWIFFFLFLSCFPINFIVFVGRIHNINLFC